MSNSGLSRQQLGILFYELLGTYDSIESHLQKNEFEADPEEVECDLESMNLERCPYCDLWFESGELVTDDGNDDVVGCESCR
jgi:hypothetical protein